MVAQVVVQAPVRQDRMGGIKRVASIITDVRIGASESIVYVSDGCTLPQPAIGLCYDTTVTDEKEGVGIDIEEAAIPAFALYGGVDCFIGPENATDFPIRARRILEQGEDRAIESRLATWAAAGTDLAAGATLVESIAAVEQALDEDYIGRGIILMSRGDAVRASASGSLEHMIDGIPVTVNGTPIVASGAIADGTVYGVGAVTILRSAVFDINTIDHTTNHDWAIAEAVYAVIVDCSFRVNSVVDAG